MNKLNNRLAGASVLLAVLLGSAACGTETIAEPSTQPGRQYQPNSAPSEKPSQGPKGYSADALERKAAADKKRQDQASTDRWDRSSQYGHPTRKGLPGRP